LKISFPSHGKIKIISEQIFSEPQNEPFSSFVERLFLSPHVNQLSVYPAKAVGEITYEGNGNWQSVMRRISLCLKGRISPDQSMFKNQVATLLPRFSNHNGHPLMICRYGKLLSTWQIKHELPGRIRFKNPALYRKKNLCLAIERELMSTLGVNNYETDSLTCTVLIDYNERQINKHKIVELLDIVLDKAEHSQKNDDYDTDFPIATTTLALSAVSQYAVPALLPLSALLYMYTSMPSFTGAKRLVVEERRLGVDVLDTVALTSCFATGQIFAGSFMSWCLSLGRKLLKKTRADSRKMLLHAFGKQPRFVWILRDDIEIEIPLESLTHDDIVIVKTGETIPVDGTIKDGFGMIDQHVLTGEAVPIEKAVGDRVNAATVMLAGKILISVDKTGSETTASQITKILQSTLAYELESQSRGEALADKAVVPTLALSALASSYMGISGATAVVNCDLGTGIRIAAPLGMLSCLNQCAQSGILIKDGRALEQMNKVDTILFDKTGTLTKERPEVGRILSCNGYSEEQIIQWAAAAEQKFSHPIAYAIQKKFTSLNMSLPVTDQSMYHVGFGITVGIEGRLVKVGSARFMRMEGIEIPLATEQEVAHIHDKGHSFIMVGVDRQLAGVIELKASQRSEIQDIIKGLRERDINHLAIISGDHEKPTRNLAERLNMDRYFAEVLPQDKAKYVELLQSEGRTVCFVGDGINDAIALKKANVSVSLRGASSLATDTAQVVFMEASLTKLCYLVDISKALEQNIKTSWKMIVIPNIVCVAGVFTMGFGLWHSVLLCNVSIIAAMVNGIMPLHKLVQTQKEKAKELEIALQYSSL
jgi:heavy metal translocating P-type ATPase